MQNVPRRHHYIPQFYTKQWLANDGCLCEISRPDGKTTKPRRTSPKGTGYEYDLYRLQHVKEELSQHTEASFFKIVDNDGARALRKLQPGLVDQLTADERADWARFVLSLMIRTPRDIAALREAWSWALRNNNEKYQARYEEMKRPEDPPTFEEFAGNHMSAGVEIGMHNAYYGLIDHEERGRVVINYHWYVLDLNESKHELLTSDSPVGLMNFSRPDSHVSLPIGPRRLFVASKKRALIEQLLSQSHNSVARHSNEFVASRSMRYVYSTNDSQLRFVDRVMGSDKRPRLLEGLIQRNRFN